MSEHKKELEILKQFDGGNQANDEAGTGIWQIGRQLGKTETTMKFIEAKIKSEVDEIRKFEGGAIRDSERGKEDYIETISWIAFRRYAQYMTKCKERYGSGNFKKHIPIDAYERSLVRHLQKYLANKYEEQDLEKESDHLCGMLFNIFGILHEEETERINKSKLNLPENLKT